MLECVRQVKRYGSASRQELMELIVDKLSDALDEQQKRNKFRNLLSSMSTRDKTIEKSGSLHKGHWGLTVLGCAQTGIR